MIERHSKEVVDEALGTHEQGETALRRWPEEDQLYVVDVLAAEVRALREERFLQTTHMQKTIATISRVEALLKKDTSLFEREELEAALKGGE